MDHVVPISEVRDNLGGFLAEAQDHEVYILKHGRPAGVLLSVEAYEKVREDLEDLADTVASLEAKLDAEPSRPLDEALADLG